MKIRLFILAIIMVLCHGTYVLAAEEDANMLDNNVMDGDLSYIDDDDAAYDDFSSEFSDKETDGTTEAGDELDIITYTEKNEENSVQINLNATIPDKFGYDIFCDIVHNESGRIFRLYGLNKNGYRAFLYAPSGTYSIIECSVYGDSANIYPLKVPDAFTVEADDVYTIETSLVNEVEVLDEIQRRIDAEQGINEDIMKENRIETSFYVYPWREVIKSENLRDLDIRVSGTSKGKYDIVFKIVKDGEINDAEFIYSVDGGENWSNNQLLKRSFSVGKTGLTFDFPNDSPDGWRAYYRVGDEIKFYSEEEVDITSITSKGGVIYVYYSDICYQNAEIAIKVVKSGSTAEALFDYSLDGGSTFKGVEMPMGADFVLEEVPVTVCFTDVSGSYVVNDIYKFSIKGEAPEEDKTYLIYILVVLVGIAALAGYIWLLSFREKDSEFILNEYTPWKEVHPLKLRNDKTRGHKR